jgi:hypothetical protein
MMFRTWQREIQHQDARREAAAPRHPHYGCPMSPCPDMSPAQASLNVRATAAHLNLVLRNPRATPAEVFYLARKLAQYVRAAGHSILAEAS